MIQFYTKHPKLMLTAAFALLLLGSCAKDPAGADGPGAGADIALYIPAPERVETYSGATIDECRIDNAVVLACKDGRITGAEVVDIILGNGTQQPTLRFRKLDPGERRDDRRALQPRPGNRGPGGGARRRNHGYGAE